MIYDLIWHGITDQNFHIEADDEESAIEQLDLALSEGDEDWLEEHLLQVN
jgi:hypothetical protein